MLVELGPVQRYQAIVGSVGEPDGMDPVGTFRPSTSRFVAKRSIGEPPGYRPTYPRLAGRGAFDVPLAADGGKM
jgi:hypothetical protein